MPAIAVVVMARTSVVVSWLMSVVSMAAVGHCWAATGQASTATSVLSGPRPGWWARHGCSGQRSHLCGGRGFGLVGTQGIDCGSAQGRTAAVLSWPMSVVSIAAAWAVFSTAAGRNSPQPDRCFQRGDLGGGHAVALARSSGRNLGRCSTPRNLVCTQSVDCGGAQGHGGGAELADVGGLNRSSLGGVQNGGLAELTTARSVLSSAAIWAVVMPLHVGEVVTRRLAAVVRGLDLVGVSRALTAAVLKARTAAAVLS